MNTYDLIKAIGSLLNKSFPVVVAIALLVFFWGLAKFLFRVGGDEKAVDEGKRIMKWGVIALFVMICVWGIVVFMQVNLLPGGSAVPSPGSVPWGDYL